jgi:hypothetical protein
MKEETESSLRNVVFKWETGRWTMSRIERAKSKKGDYCASLVQILNEPWATSAQTECIRLLHAFPHLHFRRLLAALIFCSLFF